MSPETADTIVAAYCREAGAELKGPQRSDIAFILRGFETVPTGLNAHHVVNLAGIVQTQTVPHTLRSFLDELCAPYHSNRKAHS